MNVTGWRAEPEQVVSDHTARLLRWMSRTAPAPGDTIESVTSRIAGGLYELLDATAVTLWARRTDGEPLTLMAAVGEGTGTAGSIPDGATNTPSLEVPLDVSLAAPLWVSEAAGPGRNFALQLVALSNLGAVELPSLAVGLYAPTPPGFEIPPLLQGVALLWLDSQDGLLSEAFGPILDAAVHQASHFLASAVRVERLARSLRQLGEAIGSAVDGKDPRRPGQSGAASYYAGLIARSMGLGEAEAEKLEFAALVHNLGRVAVPDSILQKTGTLTQEELEAVRAATLKGADWLSSVEGMDGVAAIVRHQNESYDGSGLPDGLRGEEIPLGARILAVATRFAAMTSPRADRGPRPVVGGALDGLVGQSGTSLDPKVVEAFVHAMGRSL
jgi:HD-GYP domain-containing protein (c-di-GMP phosphodiesterase class II)